MKKLFTLLAAFTLFGNVANAQSYVLDFDGVDDYVDLGTDVADNIRTVELWLMPKTDIDSTLAVFAGIIMRNTTGCTQCEEFQVAFVPIPNPMAGRLSFSNTLTPGVGEDVFSDSKNWNANQWYHVAAVIHPLNGMSLYIDGIEQADTNSFSSASAISNAMTAIGTWGDGYYRYFNGRIEDVHFSYDALYTSNFTPPCPSITSLPNSKAVWNFNEGTGLVTVDSSGNGYNGTIYGATYVIDSICTPIGINENAENTKFTIYPNPTEGKFEVRSLELGVEKVEVYDLFGRLVLSTTTPQIDMRGFAKGVYVIKAGQAVRKLVKQ